MSIKKLDACDDEDDFAAKPAGNITINSDMSSNQRPALNERSKENVNCAIFVFFSST
jgi:hypothetical protein